MTARKRIDQIVWGLSAATTVIGAAQQARHYYVILKKQYNKRTGKEQFGFVPPRKK